MDINAVSIKEIEDLSLNAWPSHQMQVYDGWILRFSYFYTHRTNCVEQLGFSILPLEEKIPVCEEIYRWWKSPCIFKISPIGDPAVDGLLAERGYGIEHETNVMTGALRKMDLKTGSPVPGLLMEDRVTQRWIDGLFALKETTDPTHLRIVPSMYAAIPKDEIAVSVRDAEGRICATGLGILDRDCVGVYAIHVREDCRKKGYATAICRSILSEAAERGAENAYLQVVSDNDPAKHLYRKLGFTDSYRYWFRVRYQ